MAENEKKSEALDTEKAVEKKDQKVSKPKSDKPGLTTRVAAWFRATKAELKKIVWTPKDALIRNTALTLVVMAAFGIIIGLLDYAFSSAIVGLSLIL